MSTALLYFLSAAFHFYVGARVAPDLGATAGAVFVLLLVVSALFVPMGMLARRFAQPPVADTLAWAGMVCMGLLSSLIVFTLVRDVGLLALAGLSHFSSLVGADTVAWFTRASADAVAVLGVLVTGVGYANARRTASVVKVDLPVRGLPASLHGFTVVQISDVHVGGVTIREQYVARIVEAVNRLKPDLVAITGDLVDGSVPDLQQQVSPLARLVSREGSFFVTGNHEYYSGVLPWMAELERLGIRVLHNEHVVIERDGAQLVLAGVPDYGGGHFDVSHTSDPGAAMANAPVEAAVRILLAHQPRTAAAAAKAGFDVQLSGHTHGGQFWPWNHFVRFQQPFTAGLNQLDSLMVYVSRGTGYWGPPKRFLAPSEITQLRLVSASA